MPSIFVGFDIFENDEADREFYRTLVAACENVAPDVYSPLSTGFPFGAGILAQRIAECDLAVIHLDPIDSTSQLLLGMAKASYRPLMLTYDASREREIKRKLGRAWWATRSSREVQEMFVNAGGHAQQMSLFKSGVRDPHLIDEVKYDSRQTGANQLESAVRNYFGK